MRKVIIILTALAGSLFFNSCNSWLDVKPYDSMAEEQLYSTENGIQRALNGLYLSLASNDLYAENLGGVLLMYWDSGINCPANILIMI